MSLRWHFTNKSVTGAAYTTKSYSLSHSWTLRWRVRWPKHAVLSSGRGGTAAAMAQNEQTSPCSVCFRHLLWGNPRRKKLTIPPSETAAKLVCCKCFRPGHTHIRLTALFPGLPGWTGTRKAKPIWILPKQETVSGSGIRWAIW